MKYLLSIIMCALLAGCGTPRVIEEHHHHHYEADTAAVQKQIDSQLSQWHSEMQQFFSDRLEQFTSQQQQSEQQHETIQETVTETIDSLGRKVRQEQRTISRDVTRELLLTEQRITRELETRLQSTVDSIDSCWQMKYDSLSARVAQSDSSSVSKTPAGDNRSLMDRIWDKAVWFGFGSIVVVFILFSYKRRC
jgi:type IV pilus biogenesis protein CpaD/CtpE